MTMALYLSRQIGVKVLAVLVGFVLLGLSLDLLENSAEIVEVHGISGLGIYAMLRAPLILIMILPLGILLGALIAFLSLAMRSEMVILRSTGYNTVRILLLLVPLAAILGVAQGQLAGRFGPAAEQALVERYPGLFKNKQIKGEMWLRDWHTVVRIGRAEEDGAALYDITIYKLGVGGELLQRIDAASARFMSKSWLLETVVVQRPDFAVENLTEMPWDIQFEPAGILDAVRRPDLVDTDAVRRVLAGELPGARGKPFYSIKFWRGYSAFVVPAIMILFGAMASFGLSRSGGGAHYVAFGMVGGAVFVLTDGVFVSLGEVGAMNAGLAALLAPGLFFVIGLWSIVVIEE